MGTNNHCINRSRGKPETLLTREALVFLIARREIGLLSTFEPPFLDLFTLLERESQLRVSLPKKVAIHRNSAVPPGSAYRYNLAQLPQEWPL